MTIRASVGSARVLAVLIALGAGLLGAGCASLPSQADTAHNPKLARVVREYARTVRDRLSSPDEDWYSGWLGNAWVNLRGGPSRGLCYHWQSAVYEGVLPAVHEVGWEAGGLTVRTDSLLEHHVVLVYDPARVRFEDILTTPPPRPVFVLDAWARGRADVFDLDPWLARDEDLARTALLEMPLPLPPSPEVAPRPAHPSSADAASPASENSGW